MIEFKDTELGGCIMKRNLLQVCINEIEAVACGEEQVKCDGAYNDSDGLRWIYKRIQFLKK